MGHTALREDYEVDHGAVLGRGRFSTVKLVFCRRHGRHVAAKIIPLPGDDDETLISTASQEFVILSKLDHSNIIDVYDHFFDEGSLWIIMEHAQNGDLRKFVHLHRRLSEKLAKKFFVQILEGVAYMHSQDIVHRDIKCENIVVTGDEKIVKICDMGCAVSLNERTGSDTPQYRERFYGSLAYAAPEVLDRGAHEMKPADLWSTGIVLFFMVSGYLPFGCDDVPRIRTRMNSPLRWPRPLRQISKDCRDFTETVIQLRPEDRPTATDALRGKWIE